MRINLIPDNRDKMRTFSVCYIEAEKEPYEGARRLLLHLNNGQTIRVIDDDYVDIPGRQLKEIDSALFNTGKFCLTCMDYHFV